MFCAVQPGMLPASQCPAHTLGRSTSSPRPSPDSASNTPSGRALLGLHETQRRLSLAGVVEVDLLVPRALRGHTRVNVVIAGQAGGRHEREIASVRGYPHRQQRSVREYQRRLPTQHRLCLRASRRMWSSIASHLNEVRIYCFWSLCAVRRCRFRSWREHPGQRNRCSRRPAGAEQQPCTSACSPGSDRLSDP